MMNIHVEFLKTEFRELCVGWLVLRQINDIFSRAGFNRAEIDPGTVGERRTLVEQYYQSEDWDNIETVRKFLKVLEFVLLLSFISEESKDYLRSLCRTAGFEVDRNGHTIHLTTKGVGQQVKNLIFAADGPKPEIILSDSVSNDIQIVKNAEYCLVYDQPIQTHGLLWRELIDWWRSITNQGHIADRQASRELYKRLENSLASEPERLLWKTYYLRFYDNLGNELPALIPQVYLHYDPYTIQQLAGQKRLIRQRMDFLLLLSDRTRIIIEVDGKHHYATGDRANPELYSEMVAEDRKLKLAGYEIYRFGGYELQTERAESIIHEFFRNLFARHEVVPDNQT